MVDRVIDVTLPAVVRIGLACEGIVEAHELGVTPGTLDRLWSLDAMRQIAPAFARDVPGPYQLGVAQWFLEAANGMVELPAPVGIVEQWSMVEHALRSSATAVLDEVSDASGVIPSDRRPRPPAIVDYRAVGALVTRESAQELLNAARSVAACMESKSSNPIGAFETALLARLAAGDAVADAAAAAGYSRRTAYRVLNRLERQFDVQSRAELIVLAARRGWIGQEFD